jgi:hypothetical protein
MRLYFSIYGLAWSLNKHQANNLANFVLKNNMFFELLPGDMDKFGKRLKKIVSKKEYEYDVYRNKDCYYCLDWDKENWEYFLEKFL